MVEHSTADREVTGSKPVAPSFFSFMHFCISGLRRTAKLDEALCQGQFDSRANYIARGTCTIQFGKNWTIA